ncbi:hypothetical protein KP509_19G033700 [Ceratopteris richardii]|uniref:Uncharacterized protein n=1 Tax=Ceratopteris richardii TaxID=49495 RepID=A0A8T2SL57_CERRI|nr:hypothetical protein KP509_19G033700 [Ceratopteris richardii]
MAGSRRSWKEGESNKRGGKFLSSSRSAFARELESALFEERQGGHVLRGRKLRTGGSSSSGGRALSSFGVEKFKPCTWAGKASLLIFFRICPIRGEELVSGPLWKEALKVLPPAA